LNELCPFIEFSVSITLSISPFTIKCASIVCRIHSGAVLLASHELTNVFRIIRPLVLPIAIILAIF
jgi:hypothetical protein